MVHIKCIYRLKIGGALMFEWKDRGADNFSGGTMGLSSTS